MSIAQDTPTGEGRPDDMYTERHFIVLDSGDFPRIVGIAAVDGVSEPTPKPPAEVVLGPVKIAAFWDQFKFNRSPREQYWADVAVDDLEDR